MQKIGARWFRPVKSREIDLVVIHSMEASDKPDTAEAVGNYFARLPADNKASAHVGCDRDSSVRYVDDNDVAFAAPGANHNGLHCELTGFARYVEGDWLQPHMMAMLQQAAAVVREWCEKYDIPKRYVDAAGLKRGEIGITTHNEVSKAFKQSDHWDPGKGFPIKTFISMVVDQPPPVAKDDDMPPFFHVDHPNGGSWLIKREDGGVFAYDGAPFFGSLPGLGVKPNAPIVALEPFELVGQVRGYWLLGADGGVYSFGDAPFTDSYAGHPEWHKGERYFVDIEQNGDGYNLIAVEKGSDPPRRNIYDLSVKR